MNKRLRAGLLSACLLAVACGAFGASEGISGGSAGAVLLTHTHHVSSGRGVSWAIERLARASFTCNDKTNAWQVRVTNVQVIGPDKVTPWPHYDVTWGLLDSAGVVSTGGGTFAIGQNVVNGLFSGSMLGTGMGANGGIDAGACATGAEFFLYGPGNDLSLCSPIGPCYLEFGSAGGPSGLKLT